MRKGRAEQTSAESHWVSVARKELPLSEGEPKKLKKARLRDKKGR